MNIVFAGTPAFAAAALDGICAAGHTIPLVLTQPDRPAGRGMRVTPTAVATTAGRLQLRVEKPASLRDAEARQLIAGAKPDVMVVAAYGLLLPQAVLDIPARGCLNIHASLLPRWRGAAPIQRAIEAGDKLTGIGIMQMEAGLDTGPIILERTLAITDMDTSATLLERLTHLGTTSIVDALATLDQLKARPQATDGVTYAKKISREESRIDWQQSAAIIERRMRAFDPFPGNESTLGGERIKLWSAIPIQGVASAPPGEVVAISVHRGHPGFSVACGEGTLHITSAQRPGGKRMSTRDWAVNSETGLRPVKPGDQFH